MAVTNLKEISVSILSGAKSSKKLLRYQGNGTPVGDTELANDSAFAIGTEYTDLDNQSNYTKTAAATWTQTESMFSIIATATSTTTDFGALAVGDLVATIPAAAGNSKFGTVITIGTAPFAAVIGDLYIIIRK